MMNVTAMIDDKIDLKKIEEQMLAEIRYDKKQLTDPAEIGILINRLLEERKATNELFRQIIEMLDKIGEGKQQKRQEIMLSDVDQRLIDHIQRCGKVDAEEIAAAFKYKGKNAASARLNSLYQKRLLMKGRAGKKVLYWVLG